MTACVQGVKLVENHRRMRKGPLDILQNSMSQTDIKEKKELHGNAIMDHFAVLWTEPSRLIWSASIHGSMYSI